MSTEENVVDSGEILKTLVKQGAYAAAKAYVAFLEDEAARKAAPVNVPESPEEATT